MIAPTDIQVHRIGQTKEVKVYRMITSDTVEESVLKQQKSKLYLSSSLDHNPSELGQHFKIDRLQQLFTAGRISMVNERKKAGIVTEDAMEDSGDSDKDREGEKQLESDEEEDSSYAEIACHRPYPKVKTERSPPQTARTQIKSEPNGSQRRWREELFWIV